MSSPKTYAQLASLMAFTGQSDATESLLNQAIVLASKDIELQSLSEGVQSAYSRPLASYDHTVTPEAYAASNPTGDATQSLDYKRKVDEVNTARYLPKTN